MNYQNRLCGRRQSLGQRRPVRYFAQLILTSTVIIVATFASAFLSALTPGAVFADTEHSERTETVTVQLDLISPTGTSITGALVIKRSPGTSRAEIQFRGTIDGQPADATAWASEHWSDDSHGTIQVDEITAWHASVPRPSTVSLQLAQAGPGLITINGIPLAASAPLVSPGSGDRTYVATNPGKGEEGISLLPRTGVGQPLSDPLLVAAALVAVGPLLVCLGLFVNWLTRLGRHNSPDAAR